MGVITNLVQYSFLIFFPGYKCNAYGREGEKEREREIIIIIIIIKTSG